VEKSGGPTELGARHEVAIYTAGFPTPALVAALVELRKRAPDAVFRHWGDADVGGLRIWWFLRSRLEKSVCLFRTTAGWAQIQAPLGGRRFAESEAEALERLRSQIDPLTGSDIRDAVDLIDKLLEMRVKLEQERY
jgi:hypothetical protein